jgi:iron complex transport system permease protein
VPTRNFTRLGLMAAVGAAIVALTLLAGRGSLDDAKWTPTFLELRTYRALAAVMVGAALAGAGVLAQGLFRNPLASPSVLGATAGASLGGQVSLLLFSSLVAADAAPPELLVPFGTFAGAWGTLAIVLGFARRSADLVSLLLVGFVLSALFLSLGSFVVSLAQEEWMLGRAVIAFALGGVAGNGALQIGLAAPAVLGGLLMAAVWGRSLDLLATGPDEAKTLGLDVRFATQWIIVWIAVLVAGAVSLGGNVGFVGLIIPHATRRFVGEAHGWLLPAAAVGGGVFVAICDALVRIVPSQTQIPLGVITGLVGAPLFLWILRDIRQQGRLA